MKIIGAALGKACEQDSDSDAVHLARAAQIVRRNNSAQTLSPGRSKKIARRSLEKSVPHQLLALVSMVLDSPNIKDQIGECATPASLSIAQITKYNCVKHRHKQADTSPSVRHSTAQL